MIDELIIPPGKASGCLPRKSKFGDVCKVFSEEIEVIPIAHWDELIGEVSLRLDVPIIFDQDGVGSCATESATQSVQVVREVNGLEFVELNPWFVYHTTSEGSDSGSSIDDNLVFIRKNGVAPVSVWPRSKGWKAEPSDEAKKEALKYRIDEFYDIATWEEFGSALLMGFPVVFGYSGHSVLAVELLSKNKLLYANSWDESWGDKGFGILSSSSIHWGYGAWATRSVTIPDIHVP